MAIRMFARPLSVAAFAVLAACSGNGYNGGVLGNGTQPCNPGTSVTIAQPYPSGATGVSTTIGQIIIVANGSTNTLHDNPSVWAIILNDTSAGALINGSTMNAVAFPQGPHPYPSDFYYGSNIPTLNAGHNYTALLTRTDGTCSAVAVGSFST